MIDWETFKAQLKTNPSRVLKSVMLLAGCFLFIWILVIVQSDSPQQNTIKVHDSGRLDSLNLRKDSVASKSRSVSYKSPDDSYSNLYVVLPVGILFFVIIAGMWGWQRFKKKSGNPNGGDLIFTNVGSQKLPGVPQKISVIKLNGEYWVMATGGTQGVKLLHRYQAEEWKKLEKKPPHSHGQQSFWEVLTQTASKRNKGQG